jgi:type I restriction enzyme S subunit
MKRFRQAVLAAACSGRLTEGWREEHPNNNSLELFNKIQLERQLMIKNQNKKIVADPNWMPKDDCEIPEEWIKIKISDMLHYQRSAGYGVLQPGPEIPGGIPIVRVCDIQDGKLQTNQLKHISPDIEKKYKRTRLEGGEVLVTLVGTIGRTAVVQKGACGSNVARAIAVLPLCPYVDPKFVSYCLSESTKNVELIDLSREVARKTLNLGLLKAVEIPLPPLEEQHEIVRRVNTLFAFADQIEQEVAEATKRTEALSQSVLAKAFRGELVATEMEIAKMKIL